MITIAKVRLYSKELKRWKIRNEFVDQSGVLVGKTYHLDPEGNTIGPHVWEIKQIMEGLHEQQHKPNTRPDHR